MACGRASTMAAANVPPVRLREFTGPYAQRGRWVGHVQIPRMSAMSDTSGLSGRSASAAS